MAIKATKAKIVAAIAAPPAPIEPTLWQRVLDAAKDMARPTTIYLGGIAVFWACITHPEAEIVAIAAAMTGAVGYMHGDTKTKLAQIQAKAAGDGGGGK